MWKKLKSWVLVVLLLMIPICSPSVVSVYADTDDSSTEVANSKDDGEKEKATGLAGILETLYSGSITLGKETTYEENGSRVEEVKDGFKIDLGNLPKTCMQILSLDFMRGWYVGGHNLYNEVFKDGIYSVMKVLGMELAVMFWMLGMLREAMQFERTDWKRVLIGMFKIALAIMVIESSFAVGELILKFGSSMVDEVLGSISAGDTDGIVNVVVAVQEASNSVDFSVFNIGKWLGGFMNEIMTFLILLIGVFAYYATAIGIIGAVFEKMLKLLFTLSTAPISVAMSMSDGGPHQDLFGFIKKLLSQYMDILIADCILVVASWMMTGLTTVVTNPSLGTAISVVVGMLVINGLIKSSMSLSTQISESLMR